MSRGFKALILFGNVEEVIEYANRPPSESLEVRPYLYYLQSKYNTKETDIIKILMDAEDPVMIFLTGFYNDIKDLRAAIDKNPEDLLSFDEEIGNAVIGVGKELCTIDADEQQIDLGRLMKIHGFPELWVEGKAPLLLQDDTIRKIGSGNADMLKLQVLSALVYNWAKNRNIDYDDLPKLPHLTSGSVLLLNHELLHTEPNAPFTVFVPRITKPTLSVVEE